jgi:hypothetical protein
MLRDVKHEVGRSRLERHACGTVAAAVIAVTRDAPLAIDRAARGDGFGARRDGVPEGRRGVQPAGPVALFDVRPSGRDDRACSDEREE